MTAGYHEFGDGESGAPTRSAGRPGPLPPRTEHPGYPSHGTGPVWPPSGVPAPSGAPTSGYPAVPPAAPAAYPTAQLPAQYAPSAPASAPAGYGPGTPPPAPVPPGPTAPARRRSPLVAVVLILLLVIAVGQTVALVVLNAKVDKADKAQHTAQAADAKHIADLESRAAALEKQAAASLDPQAVATAVLPSVFKVEAGDFSGTAFVIKSDDSGSMLITNYHVVADLYEGGGRSVALTHDNQRFTAKIVDHNAADDVALLQTSDKFPALVASHTDVQTGAPIVVVGAPLGLAQSVTTGVVSAIRNDVPGEGGRTYIQFSAPINPGNSGGPVVDAQKEVVGIASAKAQDAEAIGLAIPIAVACKDLNVC